jgi:hypothetical protein
MNAINHGSHQEAKWRIMKEKGFILVLKRSFYLVQVLICRNNDSNSWCLDRKFGELNFGD